LVQPLAAQDGELDGEAAELPAGKSSTIGSAPGTLVPRAPPTGQRG
jgi:hypothetical protein